MKAGTAGQEKMTNDVGRNGAFLMPSGSKTDGRVCGKCSHYNAPNGLDCGTCGGEPVFITDTCANFEPREAGPDVCDLRCLRGSGECLREVCTSACRIPANIERVEAERRAGDSNGLQGVDGLLCALRETSALNAWHNGRTAQQLRIILERASSRSGMAISDFLEGRSKLIPLLRDPAVEMPDDEQDVVIVLRQNDEGRGVTTGAHHAGHGWCETQDGRARGLIIRSGMVAGWCHHHEAAEVLKKAVRHG